MKRLFILLLFLIPSLLSAQNVMDYNPSMWLLYPDSVTLVGGKVDTWTDTTGNGNSFQQTTDGYRPLGISGVGVEFDGVDDMLPIKTGAEYNFGMNATIFIRARIDSLKDCCFLSGNGSGTSMIMRYYPTTNTIYLKTDGGTAFDIQFTADTTTSGDGSFHVYTFTKTDSTDSDFFLDGVQKTRKVFTETDGDAVFALDGIGHRQSASDFEFNGVISEIIWFESVLSIKKRQLVEYYLTNGEFPTNYYVDPDNGSDDSTGAIITQALASFDSINTAGARTVAAGDYVLQKTGTKIRQTLTVPSFGTSGNPITITCYDSATGLTGAAALALGDTATISGTDIRSSWTEYTGTTGDILEDNFDDGDMAGWTKTAGVDTTSLRSYTSDYSVLVPSAYKTFYQTFTAEDSAYFRAYVNFDEYASANLEFLQAKAGGTSLCVVYLNSSGVVGVWNYIASGSYSSSTTVPLDTWTLVELKWKVGNGTGQIQVKINGSSVINQTSINTGTDSITTFNTGTQLAGGDPDVYFDNVGYDSTGYLGVVPINTHYATLAADPNCVVVDGTFIEEKTTLAALTTSETWFWSAGDTRLYFKTDGSTAIGDYTIETFTRSHCIYIDNKDYITFEYLTFAGPSQYLGIYGDNGGEGLIIQNCVFNNFNAAAIEFTGGADDNLNITIQNNVFTDAGNTYPINLHPNVGATSTGVIDNNTFEVSFFDGTSTTLPASNLMKAVQSTDIDNLTISDNTITFPDVTGDTSTLLSTGTPNPLIESNTITGGNHGITVHNATSGGIVRYNKIISPYDDAIWVYGTSDSTQIYYNVGCDGADDGIDINSAPGCYLYNNDMSRFRDTGYVIRETSTDVIMKNNIGFENGQAGTPVTGDEGGHEVSVTANSKSGFVAQNNNYYHTTAKVTATPFDWGGSSIAFTVWQDSTNSTNELDSDPLFTDAANDDFTLKERSPAIDAGTSVGLTLDYAGNTVPFNARADRSPDYDIGAYEYSRRIPWSGEKRFIGFPSWWKFPRR